MLMVREGAVLPLPRGVLHDLYYEVDRVLFLSEYGVQHEDLKMIVVLAIGAVTEEQVNKGVGIVRVNSMEKSLSTRVLDCCCVGVEEGG